jgi:hypothetical protein
MEAQAAAAWMMQKSSEHRGQTRKEEEMEGKVPNQRPTRGFKGGRRDPSPSTLGPLLAVNFRQPSHEFTFNVGIDLLF